MLKSWIEKALTKTVTVMMETSRSGKRRKTARNFETVEIPPSKRLVYGVYFAMVALIALTAVEIVHIVHIGSFSSEIFSAITGLIGTIIGVLVTSKG